MSEPQLTHLLDRAVHHAPPMHLDGQDLLAAGKGRVRRRRAGAAGLVAGALAVTAAVWGGLSGGGDGPLGTREIQPATTVFEDGEVVDATLFVGYRTIDTDQVGHDFTGRLTRGRSGPLTLEVLDGGAVVEEVPAASSSGVGTVPGLEVFEGASMLVALWREPEGVVTSVPLVGPVDPGGPTGRRSVKIDGERFGYAVWPRGVEGLVVPDSVRDVYLLGEDDVVALSGAEVASQVLAAGDARALVWSQPEAGVWGYDVPGTDTVLEDLGGRPAQFAGYVVGEEGRTTAVTVLPEGASAVEVRTEGGSSASTVLEGRPVVLVAARGDEEPEVVFTLQGRRQALSDYAEDLFALETPAGRSLSVELPAEGGVVLAEASGEQLLSLGPEELHPSVGAWPTQDGTVVAAVGWSPDGTVLSAARVEVLDGGSDQRRWVTPHDVAQVPGPSGEVTLMSVEVEDGATVTALGLERGGEIERWDPPADAPQGLSADGVDWDLVDGQLVPTVGGTPLEQTLVDSLGDARVYPLPGSGNDLLVLPAGIGAEDTVVPLQHRVGADTFDPASWLLDRGGVAQTPAGPVRVHLVPTGLLTEGTRLALRTAEALKAEAFNVWTVLGGQPSGHLALEGGVAVSLGGDQPGDPWLLYPAGDDSVDGHLRAGVVGSTLEGQAWPDDDQRYQLVAVLPAGSTPQLLLEPGGETSVEEEIVHQAPIDRLEVWTATVRTSAGRPLEQVRGLDLDGDGEPELTLPRRG